MENSINDLLQEAQVYYQSGAWKQAADSYESVLNQCEDPLLCGQVCSAIGAIYQEQGEPNIAVRNYEQAFEAYQKAEPEMNAEERHQMAGLSNNLGNLLAALRQYKAADAYFRAAVKRYEALAETDEATFQPYLALTVFNRAQAAARGGDHYNWRKSIKQAVALYEGLVKQKPVFQPYLGNALTSLADSYTDEDPLMAELYWKQGIRAYEAALSNDPSVLPLIAAGYNNLAFAQKQERAYSKAVLSYTQALEAYNNLAETRPEDFQPFVANTYNNLGVLFAEMGEREEAILNYERALKEYDALETQQPGLFLPYQATLYHNLGVLYDEKQAFKEALPYYQRALRQRQVLAADHPEGFMPDVAVTALNMATLFQSLLELTADMQYQAEGLAMLPVIESALSQIEQESPALASMQSDLAYFRDFFSNVQYPTLEAARLMREIALWQEEQLSTLEHNEKLSWQHKIVDALATYHQQHPGHRSMEEELAQAYAFQAWLLLLAGQTSEALIPAQKAVALNPTDPQPFVNHGHVQLMLGNLGEALKSYNHVKTQITADKKRVVGLVLDDLKVLTDCGLDQGLAEKVGSALQTQQAIA
ncbi:tetratricopeptide repeat protein [Phaeodactylibacter xiamenensis]|uniref:tetratricopeptide repeat protein n=1 Tax=Phaeodactylibacter xiamenensis TaxID=1524460 RepID=UPI003BA95C32